MTDALFIETREYQRFHEFCDACRKYQYIGLCYGPPGVGKTMSARYYTHRNKLGSCARSPPCEGRLEKGLGNQVVLYTPSVVNSPGQIARELGRCRQNLCAALLNHLYKEEKPKLEAMEQRLEHHRRTLPGYGMLANDEQTAEYRRERDAYFAAWNQYRSHRRDARDRTMLLVMDEADRLRVASLEQVRALFDQGGMGLVLIGMPGLEKRLARYPQLYSRVGFVHQFGPLGETETRRLFQHHQWQPPGVTLPAEALAHKEAIAAIIRVTGGNFRLLDRLLTQIARVLEINGITAITPEVVETARESLVIGTA